MRGAPRIRVMGKSIRGRVSSKVVNESVADTSRKFFRIFPIFAREKLGQASNQVHDKMSISKYFFKILCQINENFVCFIILMETPDKLFG